MPNDAELSKLLSHALRHEPWLYELELDDEGWASLDAVLGALREQRAEWRALSRADVERMIESSSKRRHEVVGDRQAPSWSYRFRLRAWWHSPKIGDPTRSIPSHELLDIYRGRREGAQSRGRPTESLDALVELFAANQGETWRIFTVSGAGADGGVFVSSSGRAGCFARQAGDS